MRKFKMLALSLIAAVGLGLSVQVSNIQASESTEPLITPASDQIYAERIVGFTKQKSMWVTETRNGKTYSGYIYNRGIYDSNGLYVLFNGYIKVGPYQPLAYKLEN